MASQSPQRQLLRHPRALGVRDTDRTAAVALHERTLLELATDARCNWLALPDDHPDKRRMLARARTEKAALILDPQRLEQLSKLAAKLLCEQADEAEGGEAIPVLIDLSATGAQRHDWPVCGDIVPFTREVAANEVLDELRDLALDYSDADVGDETEHDIQHVLRVNDGRSKPKRYRPDAAELFVEHAPRLVAMLNRPYQARTDRANGNPLIHGAVGFGLGQEQSVKLRVLFTDWAQNNRAEDVARDELEALLRATLRAFGVGKNAAENALRTQYQRETMSDRRQASRAQRKLRVS